MKAHLAKDVGDRLEVGAATEQRSDGVELGGRDRAIVMQVQLEPIEAEHAADQLLGVESSRRDPLGVQVRSRQRDDVLDVLHAPGHGLSHRRRRPRVAGDSSRPGAQR